MMRMASMLSKPPESRATHLIDISKTGLLVVRIQFHRIVLQDGTIETSDRVWESDRYVHFILKGTNGVEIRYAKDIVSRIERDNEAIEETPLITASENADTTVLKAMHWPS